MVTRANGLAKLNSRQAPVDGQRAAGMGKRLIPENARDPSRLSGESDFVQRDLGHE
jgi:hypothetical protein